MNKEEQYMLLIVITNKYDCILQEERQGLVNLKVYLVTKLQVRLSLSKKGQAKLNCKQTS